MHRKGRRRCSLVPRPVRDPREQPGERWSVDFISDTLSSGRTFRRLAVTDEFSRECLALHAEHSIPAGGGFLSLHDARMTIQRGMKHYNRVRPHSALGDLPPAEFALSFTPRVRE